MRKLLLFSCLFIAASYLATCSAPEAFQINKTTGAVTDTYAGFSGSNGRGVVVVGTTMYYTSATPNSVYSYNLTTHTNNGELFSVAGSTGLSTIANHSTNFWIGPTSSSHSS